MLDWQFIEQDANCCQYSKFMCFAGLNLHSLRDQGITETIKPIWIFYNISFLLCPPLPSPPTSCWLPFGWLVFLPDIYLMATKDSSGSAGWSSGFPQDNIFPSLCQSLPSVFSYSESCNHQTILIKPLLERPCSFGILFHLWCTLLPGRVAFKERYGWGGRHRC